jgi:hypothetical protein
MPTLTEADIAVMRAIEEEAPTANKHMLRLELMGLVRDEATGARLTVAGRRALRAYRPPRRAAAPEAASLAEGAAAPEPAEESGTRRSRPRKERVNNLF